MITCDSEELAWAKKFEMQTRMDAGGEFEAQPYTFGEAASTALETKDYKPVTRDLYRGE